MSHAAAAAAAVYVRGCTAAQAAAWWDGCAERCDTGQTKFKDVQSGGIHPEARDGKTAQRGLFHLQIVSFLACTSGPGGGTGPQQPLTSPPARSPRSRWVESVSMRSGCGGFLTDGVTYNCLWQTSEAAFRLHRAAERQRSGSGAQAGVWSSSCLTLQRWANKLV